MILFLFFLQEEIFFFFFYKNFLRRFVSNVYEAITSLFHIFFLDRFHNATVLKFFKVKFFREKRKRLLLGKERIIRFFD